jgi:hypothetical protein
MAHLEKSPLATYHYRFESPYALAAFIDSTPNRFATDEGLETRKDDWAGTSTYQEALALLNQGWKAGRDKLVTAKASAAPMAVMIPSHTYDVAGAYPIVPLACAGEPCNMWAPTEEERKTKPIIKVGINIAASGAYSAQEFINYGAAILSYVDALETGNMRAEIWVLNSVTMSDGKSTYLLEVKAKAPEEHLDLDRLAFMLANPAMLRRFVFGHKSRAPEYERGQLEFMYGRPNALAPRDDMLTLSGLNTLAQPGERLLKSPHKIIEKLGPMLDAQLSGLGHTPPEIVW